MPFTRTGAFPHPFLPLEVHFPFLSRKLFKTRLTKMCICFQNTEGQRQDIELYVVLNRGAALLAASSRSNQCLPQRRTCLFTLIIRIASQFLSFWVQVLGIPTIGLGQGGHRLLHDNQVPFIYCFSSHVVPKPCIFHPSVVKLNPFSLINMGFLYFSDDWGDWIDVSGYWFLDNASFSSTPWNPPADLVDFIKAGTPPVYIGKLLPQMGVSSESATHIH